MLENAGYFRFSAVDGRIGSDFSHDLDGRIDLVPSLLSIEIKNNKARHKIRIVNTARWP